jgi:hypothetical protein
MMQKNENLEFGTENMENSVQLVGGTLSIINDLGKKVGWSIGLSHLPVSPLAEIGPRLPRQGFPLAHRGRKAGGGEQLVQPYTKKPRESETAGLLFDELRGSTFDKVGDQRSAQKHI